MATRGEGTFCYSFVEKADPVEVQENIKVQLLEDLDPLKFAATQYKVELPYGMNHQLMNEIMQHLPEHAKKEKRERENKFECTGFF